MAAAKKTEPEAPEGIEPEGTEAESTEPEAPEAAAVVLEGEVEVIVALNITGLRNGEPWPAVGERITLPADEVATYLRTGIVKAIED